VEVIVQLRRAGRYLGLDRNPLRRGVDVIEAWFRTVLIAALFVAGPLLAWHVGMATYRNGMHEAHDVRDRFQVRAVLQEDALGYAVSSDYAARPIELPVHATWNGPHGDPHTGGIMPGTARRAGAVVTIWTDAQGNVVAAPPQRDQALANGFGVATMALFGCAALVVGGGLLMRAAFNRRRLARWKVQWMSVEPHWSGRR
jgi:hypothetical protein